MTTRKSYANTHTWKYNVNKVSRGLGECYTGVNGIQRPARSIKAGCASDCSYECHLNFETKQRQRIHKHFWSLSTSEKHQFYLKMVDQIRPKRKRVPSSTLRLSTYVYHFELRSKRLQVCSRFFFATLDVNRKRLYRVFGKSAFDCSQNDEDQCAEKPDLH